MTVGCNGMLDGTVLFGASIGQEACRRAPAVLKGDCNDGGVVSAVVRVKCEGEDAISDGTEIGPPETTMVGELTVEDRANVGLFHSGVNLRDSTERGFDRRRIDYGKEEEERGDGSGNEEIAALAGSQPCRKADERGHEQDRGNEEWIPRGTCPLLERDREVCEGNRECRNEKGRSVLHVRRCHMAVPSNDRRSAAGAGPPGAKRP